MPVSIFQPSMRRASIRFKKVILYVFHAKFSLFASSRPTHSPVLPLSVCSSTNSARCSVRSRPGQPVHGSNIFLHTALLRQHQANHFSESLTWSYLQFRTPTSATTRQHFSLLDASRIINLQLLTVNQRLASISPSRLPAPLAIPPTSAPRPLRLDINFRDSHAHSVSSCALHFMSTLTAERESPPRTVSYRTSPPVYAEVFSVSENKLTPAQFTFQSFDRFLLGLLRICVTCFLFLNLTLALYLLFQ